MTTRRAKMQKAIEHRYAIDQPRWLTWDEDFKMNTRALADGVPRANRSGGHWLQWQFALFP